MLDVDALAKMIEAQRLTQPHPLVAKVAAAIAARPIGSIATITAAMQGVALLQLSHPTDDGSAEAD